MAHQARFPSLFFRQRLNATGTGLLCGVSLFLFLPTAAPFLVVLFGLFALIFAVFRKGEERKILLCILAGVSFALVLMGICGIQRHFLEKKCGMEFVAEGYVTSTGEESFDLALVTLDGKAFWKKVRFENDMNPKQGDKLRIFLTLSEPFPEKHRSEGIDCMASAEKEGERIGRSILYSFAGAVREHLLETFSKESSGGFLSAILLGSKEGITPWKSAFEKTASLHILAISGLHISQFIGFFVVFFRVLPIRRRVGRILLFPIVGILFLFAGAGISVFRASFMTLFSMTALLFRRRSDSVTNLVFAACILILFCPYTLENYSFLFSFLSTFAMVICAVPLSEEHLRSILEKREKPGALLSVAKAVVSSFSVSSAVFVFTLPLQLLLIDRVQLFSPVYALILVPLFQLCLIAALFAAIFSFLPFSVPFLAKGCILIQEWFLGLVTALSKASPPLVSLGNYGVFLALFVLFFLAFFLIKKEKLSRIYLLYFASSFLLFFLSLI